MRDGVFATDADVAKTTVATLAALALATLAASESSLDELAARLDWSIPSRFASTSPPSGASSSLESSSTSPRRTSSTWDSASKISSDSDASSRPEAPGASRGSSSDPRRPVPTRPSRTRARRHAERYLAPGWTTGVIAGVAWQPAEAYLCRDMDATATMATTMTFGGDAEAIAAAARIDPAAAASSVIALVASTGVTVFSYFVP